MLSNSKTVSDEWLDQELDKRELAREQVLIDITTLSVSAPVVTNIGQKAA